MSMIYKSPPVDFISYKNGKAGQGLSEQLEYYTANNDMFNAPGVTIPNDGINKPEGWYTKEEFFGISGTNEENYGYWDVRKIKRDGNGNITNSDTPVVIGLPYVWKIICIKTINPEQIILAAGPILLSDLESATMAAAVQIEDPSDIGKGKVYASTVGKWCSLANKTIIDGGTIITGSIGAEQIAVERLSAIQANMGEITAGNLHSLDYLNRNNDSFFSEAGMEINLDKKRITSPFFYLGPKEGEEDLGALKIKMSNNVKKEQKEILFSPSSSSSSEETTEKIVSGSNELKYVGNNSFRIDGGMEDLKLIVDNGGELSTDLDSIIINNIKYETANDFYDAENENIFNFSFCFKYSGNRVDIIENFFNFFVGYNEDTFLDEFKTLLQDSSYNIYTITDIIIKINGIEETANLEFSFEYPLFYFKVNRQLNKDNFIKKGVEFSLFFPYAYSNTSDMIVKTTTTTTTTTKNGYIYERVTEGTEMSFDSTGEYPLLNFCGFNINDNIAFFGGWYSGKGKALISDFYQDNYTQRVALSPWGIHLWTNNFISGENNSFKEFSWNQLFNFFQENIKGDVDLTLSPFTEETILKELGNEKEFSTSTSTSTVTTSGGDTTEGLLSWETKEN